MRICLVSQEYPPETAHGGIGSQTYLKAHGLAALGHEVTVISHSVDENPHESMDRSVRVIRIPQEDDGLGLDTEPVQWLRYSFAVARTISQIHRETPFDLVDFPEWAAEGYIFLLNRSAWNKIPAVVHLHGPLVMFAHTMGWPELDSEFYRAGTAMEGTCLRLADAVFSSSACSADWCARHYGIQRDAIPILHLGVDTNLFRPLDVPKEGCPTLIFVGKIARNKGVELLVQAACHVAREFPNLRLRMLGKGPNGLMEELKTQAHAAGYPHLLELPGFVEREKLPQELSRAHVFVAPSAYEGGPGLVYLEAMACGLPVIACDGSGVTEVVQRETNGQLIPPGDKLALVEALRSLLRNEEKRKIMGERARQYAVESADSRNRVKQLEAFYSSVISHAANLA